MWAWDYQDALDGAPTDSLRLLAEVCREVRKLCPGAPLKVDEVNKKIATQIVLNYLRTRALNEKGQPSTRETDLARIVPLAARSLFVPTRSEVEAQLLLRTAFVRERQRRYGGGRRTWIEWLTGVDLHRDRTIWEEEPPDLAPTGDGNDGLPTQCSLETSSAGAQCPECPLTTTPVGVMVDAREFDLVAALDRLTMGKAVRAREQDTEAGAAGVLPRESAGAPPATSHTARAPASPPVTEPTTPRKSKRSGRLSSRPSAERIDQQGPAVTLHTTQLGALAVRPPGGTLFGAMTYEELCALD